MPPVPPLAAELSPAPTASASATPGELKRERLASLDQFRGYSVIAMFVVNFLVGLAVTHQLLRHNNTHFSYADSIMPSFIFACGFSYRMSFLKRVASGGGAGRFVVRGLALMLLSVMLYGFNSEIGSWAELSATHALRLTQEFFKANLWEVLAIIGALQVLAFPLISRRTSIRALAFVALGLLHGLLCWSFNYDFVYGRPNWMDGYLGGAGKRAWDGGLFGLLAWTQILLAGTIAFDVVRGPDRRRALATILLAGGLLLFCGYALSCLTRLYDLQGLTSDQTARIKSSPVLPDWSLAVERGWRDWLAQPPLVAPPPVEQRALNYWMMDKRVVTQSFVLFATGCCLVLYAAFIVACDWRGWGSRALDMFGANPLAAYIINHFVNHSIRGLVPKDSPLAWSLLGLAAALGITYLFVRFLDTRKLYLRL